MEKPVICRVAPSPTGTCHLGTARTALYSFLTARRAGGTFIIRMEDTDRARSTQEFADNILEGLKWLGITSDVDIVYQSQRSDIYKKYVDILLEKGLAYKCYCTSEELEAKRQAQLDKKEKPLYDRTCDGKAEQPGKPFVIRFRTPDHGSVVWKDLVLGKVTVLKAEISDFIIQRQDGTVGYLLANMIDDALQGVTHIVRGIDGQSNVPAQVMLYEALGFEVPTYAHTPFILNDKGEKLSKRNGDASLLDYREKGFLPEAMINTLVRIGWSHGNEEIFSMDDLIGKFDLNKVGKTAGSLDPAKMLHINGHWLKVGDPERIAELLMPFMVEANITPEQFKRVHVVDMVKTLQKRAKTLVEMAEMAKFYYADKIVMERELLPEEKFWLTTLGFKLDKIEFTSESVEKATNAACDVAEIKVRKMGPAIRMALSGKENAPGIYEMMMVLGKEETLNRIIEAIK